MLDSSISFFEEEIDDVIFMTNEFLTDSTLIGTQGPFWYILQMSMALAARFSVILAGNIAYKMMVKKEPLDVMKLVRPLTISFILCWWYPPSMTGLAGSQSGWCFLDYIAYIPNCIGSYTHDLYEAEAAQVKDRFDDVHELLALRDTCVTDLQAKAQVGDEAMKDAGKQAAENNSVNIESLLQSLLSGKTQALTAGEAGLVCLLDKIIMCIAIIVFRIGWWGTIYCQQILLGMLTIFGPIQWAFSLLPKWEGAWAKWLIRYLTVHFYGAMLYFVGFYVLLLFDIVINIQYYDLEAVTAGAQEIAEFTKNSFFSAAYLMAASVVSLKCLNLVPDLAAWMIPEGDTAFSTRNFGEGVAGEMRSSAMRLGGKFL